MTRLGLPSLILCSAFLQAQTPAAPLPEALTAHLQAFTLLHVDFTQTRTLAALSRPLKASGSMVLSKEKGVIWQVRKPVALGYVITPRGLAEVGADGKARVKTVKDAPVVAHMGRILQSLLQGRWSALDEFFTIRAEGSPGQWKVIMLPRPQAAAFLKGIQVSGGRFIERVQVTEGSGDRMDLAFERPRADEPLTEAEARLLSAE